MEDEINTLENLKARFAVSRPESIREKLLAWAFEDADDAEAVIDSLERIDCAACNSPAPIYNHDMAREIGEHWQEIDAACESYRDHFGEAWTPKEGQSFLYHLWFAYESTACDLADEIRCELETIEGDN